MMKVAGIILGSLSLELSEVSGVEISTYRLAKSTPFAKV